MEIIKGKYCGFCQGVTYTINKAYDILKNNKKIYCLGEIIHNENVVKELENLGMITVNNIDDIPNNETVIFRAHGESEKIYDIAKDKNLNIIDLTCGKVKLIHQKIIKYRNDYFIIIIGKHNHPETIGSNGFAKNSFILENEDELNNLFKEIKSNNYQKIYIVAQTTFNDQLFDKLVNEIKKHINSEIIIDKTICSATFNRQKEVFDLSKQVNKMIIIGGRNSSNTKELYKVAKNNCDSFLVQDVNDLKNISFNKSDIVGITAGASTPNKDILEVIKYLKEHYL